ncbi:hypothetical protein ACFWH1_18610 [Streptomyces sp. NPDC127037]|uniref:hypothetical protein n=1 Tax=Streptomyces sp. NPDC127037 TaxID=3347113 RepID=UPI00365CB4D6
MAAHLHAVPDPEPDEAPGPGDWPIPIVVVAPRPPADDETPVDAHHLEDAPAGEGEQDPDDDQDDVADDEDPDDDLGEEEGERRGLLADLRPYYDVRQLPVSELRALAVEVGKTAGPPLRSGTAWTLHGVARFLRSLAHMLAWYGRGIGVLLVLATGWLSGKYGKRGSLGARFGGAAFLVYAVVRLSQKYENAWLLLVIGLIVIVALAASGHIEIPVSKPAKKADDKKKATKGDEKKGGTAKKAAAPEKKEGDDEMSKQDAPTPPQKGRLARLLGRRAAPPEKPPVEPGEADVETPEEDRAEGEEEGPEEVAEEAPAAPSTDDVIRALHHLYRGGSGVLHTALAQHLQLPHTRAVKEALKEAGITHRMGVRTPAGNGPGVHHSDFPPLPLSQEDPQGAGVVAGQTTNANANNAESGPEEGLVAGGNVWTSAELAQGYRWVRDESKPCAWKIERHDKR